jgi:hypothetical protein
VFYKMHELSNEELLAEKLGIIVLCSNCSQRIEFDDKYWHRWLHSNTGGTLCDIEMNNCRVLVAVPRIKP